MGLAAPRKKGDRAQRRNDHRDSLLEAVERLTAEGEAYSSVTIDRLATAAGISRATFYIYFDGKGDLLQSWFTETLGKLREASASWRTIDATSSEADLADALKRIVDAYREGAALLTAINDEATQDSSLQQRLDDAVQACVDSLADQIERGQVEGWLDPELLPAETAAWSVWMLDRGLNQIVPGADQPHVTALTKTLANMAWHTLYLDPSQRHEQPATTP